MVIEMKNSNAPLIKTEIPGPKSRKYLEMQKEMETNSVIYPDSFPIAIKSADGSIIEDVDGNRFIDWVTGISVLNLGYNENIRKAVKEQMDKIWHALEIPTEARIDFMNELRKSFPEKMRDYKIMFGISGADACETAINIAHKIHGGNHNTIAFEGAYHGVSGGIIGATAGVKYKSQVFTQGFDVIRIPYPYKLWYDFSIDDIVESIRKIMIDPEAGYRIPDSIIVEPILGEGGYVVPPDGFLKALREVSDEFNLTLIVDEVQTGVGRTGKMWAFEWENITPDIVCISKSIGGGIPVSVIYYKNEFDKMLPKPFHLGTYRANPLALSAGTFVLKEVPKYLDRVQRDGKMLLKRFSEINSDIIAEVRGKGFMVGIELVENKKPLKYEKVLKIKHNLLKNGLMMHTCGHFSNVFRFMGAINIPDDLLNKGLDIFENVLSSKNQ